MQGNSSGGPASQAGLLSRFDSAYAHVENVFNMLAALGIFVIMMIGIAEVVLRSAFNFSIFGYLDVIELTMAVFAFLGAAYCQRHGSHIRMDLAVSFLRGRAQYVVEALAIILALIAVGILIKATYAHFLRSLSSGDSTIDANLLVWPSKLMAPIGLGLLWLRLWLNLFGYVRLIAHPEAVPVAVPPPPGGHGHGAGESDVI